MQGTTKSKNERLARRCINKCGETVELEQDGSNFEIVLRSEGNIMDANTSNKKWAEWLYEMCSARRPAAGETAGAVRVDHDSLN